MIPLKWTRPLCYFCLHCNKYWKSSNPNIATNTENQVVPVLNQLIPELLHTIFSTTALQLQLYNYNFTTTTLQLQLNNYNLTITTNYNLTITTLQLQLLTVSQKDLVCKTKKKVDPSLPSVKKSPLTNIMRKITIWLKYLESNWDQNLRQALALLRNRSGKKT